MFTVVTIQCLLAGYFLAPNLIQLLKKNLSTSHALLGDVTAAKTHKTPGCRSLPTNSESAALSLCFWKSVFKGSKVFLVGKS